MTTATIDQLKDSWTGPRVSRARKMTGLTRAAFAKAVGTEEKTVFRWEHGQSALNTLSSRALTFWAERTMTAAQLADLLAEPAAEPSPA